ncbi:hypothetical protein [Flavobacterium sedimenticola]|uniref:Uncharacterized protein n=1 Tax=Flavobacterium sedimenticola TaxID=3043286 RepID=A0ABT6XMK7_9FLAO|nr:hypothetical protein [Flavobacterium sedimenticola]MDI9256311.1 hypothetical protein [Flavobacterium sedimenticola]
MKKITPYIVIAVLLAVIVYQCTGEKSTKPVNVPEVKGSFEAVKPTNQKPITVTVTNTVKDTAEINRLKRLYNYSQEEIERILKENQSLDSLAMATNDKMSQQIYELSKYREFSHTFENDTLKALIAGVSRGPVDRIAIPQFTIKKRTVTVPEKKPYLSVYAGGELGMNKELNQGTYKLNLTVQDGKKNLYSGSFQKIAGQDFWLVGFQKHLFTLKK